LTREIWVELSDELDDAIEAVAISRGLHKSRILEMFMREHPIIREEMEIMRAEPVKGPLAVNPKSLHKRGRAP